MGTLQWRDLWRFAGAYIVIALVDLATLLALGWSKNSATENLIFAVAFTLLCAIREEANDRQR